MNRIKMIALALLLLQSTSSLAEEFEGVLRWGQQTVLGFPLTGVIAEVSVQTGSRVKHKQQLAALDKTPFDSQIKKARAGVDRIEPMLFDVQQDYHQAQELFDRTVLSEVELQKAEVKLKGVKAEQAMANADLELARWQHRQSQLTAPFDAIVVHSNLVPGMVVSEENQSELRIELAQQGIMQVELKLTVIKLAAISMNQQVKVQIGKDSYSGTVKRIEMMPDASGLYGVQVEFSHPVERTYYAQQAARVVF